MATKSILKVIVAKNRKQTTNMVDALEKAKSKPKKNIVVSKKVKELSPAAISQIWGR